MEKAFRRRWWRRNAIAGAILLLNAGGCSQRDSIAGRSADPGAPAIVTLESHDYRLIITAHHGGPRYSIGGRDGCEIARELTLEQLRVHHPSIYSDFAPALATGDQRAPGARDIVLADDGSR